MAKNRDNAAGLEALKRENEKLRTLLRESAQANVQLHATNSELHTTNTRLRAAIEKSAQQPPSWRSERIELLEQLEKKKAEIAQLQHQLQVLLRQGYGRSSERFDRNQLLLFNDLLDQIPETPAEDEEADDRPRRKRRRKGHGRRKLPPDLPRQKVVYDLPDEQKPCPCCRNMRYIINRDVHEQLDIVPMQLTVIEHIRLTYGCPHCEATAAPDGPQIVAADKPPQPIEKGLAAPGLLAYVIVSKYADHLPLHRLEGILKRHKVDIARSTMCDWAAQCAALLRPLVGVMNDEVLASTVIHTDDTPVLIQGRGGVKPRNGRFWVYVGEADHPCTVFDFTPSRSRDGPMSFLRNWGKNERVYLQADAFGGYDGIYEGRTGGEVTEVACWAHARRKFYDAREAAPAIRAEALARIGRLYLIERVARELAQRRGRDLAAERLRLRQKFAVPRLARLKEWLLSLRAECGGPVLPKSPLGKAIRYAMNQWDALCTYTTDGRLAIDNNAAENALRRIAVGRKNWLFAGSENGGATAAVLFSLIATCERHGVDPLAYLRDVLARIPATPVGELRDLLPDRWQPLPEPSPEPPAEP
ncbi:MAG: IS66 family transposase [Planctomycetota bacterium]|nr:IS66 family transposase [Planctomycetota bacterium]